MNGEIEAGADVATGLLVAGAIDGVGGCEGAPRDGRCLNCDAILAGAYCHTCGQRAHVHRSLGALLHDLLHGVLHFEGRIWRTLPMLALHPGALTRRYIVGERARFVSPLALFLFSVFLMVATFSTIGGPVQIDGAKNAPAIVIDGKPMSEVERKQVGAALAEASEEVKIETGIDAIDDAARSIRANPELFFFKLQTHAYKFSWALIPISLPFIWLMFAFRRDVGLYDHAIFAIFSLSAMTLLAVLLAIAAAIGLPGTNLALVLLPPLHMYRQLKGAYGLGRLGTLWRTAWLVTSAYLSAMIFFLVLVALEA